MKPWVKTGLFFALWMFVFMTFVAPYIYVLAGLEDESTPKFPITKIIINAVVFTVMGLIMGYINRSNTKKTRKQINA